MSYPPPQQQPYGYGPRYPQPRKSKTGLIVGLAIGGVVLVGGGVTAAVLLTAGSEPPDPLPVAQQFSDGVTKRDPNLVASVLCDPPSQSEVGQWVRSWNEDGIVAGAVELHSKRDESAGVLVNVSQRAGTARDRKYMLTLVWKEDRWCHDGMLSATGLPT
ncbi:hypothetical protein [Amycolatopsis sp. CA-230715]|uniref:hypothetical protein n=1 Tax=Amycolatopsis sp. CA-230715 TaxID=2745196 RepID=UPI001C026D79|nr:hypothetical protein [Amycolatopsis sp. CA-230715]QWF80580.1 hypothetical protein HUW46_04003 [Amycolatopsis sp. CA-230715]